jgi:hypothetical protein
MSDDLKSMFLGLTSSPSSSRTECPCTRLLSAYIPAEEEMLDQHGAVHEPMRVSGQAVKACCGLKPCGARIYATSQTGTAR